MTRVFLPRSLTELWETISSCPEALLFAGGTDLFVKMRSRKTEADALIGLERIACLKGIVCENEHIRIGACATHAELLGHSLIARKLSILHQALAVLASPPIRAMATIGGNICTASPAGDTLPPLYALRAEVALASPEGSRILPLQDFITGPGQTQLRPREILTAIHVKQPSAENLHHFEKVGQRKAMSCAIASFAALLSLSPTGVIKSCRLAWGSVGPTVLTDKKTEAFLVGKKLTGETLGFAARQVEQMVLPIDDLRASADYRRAVTGRLLWRLLRL